MPFIGYEPARKPLTSADITDSVVTSAKIVDGTIAIADLSATGSPGSTTFLRGDNTWGSAGATAGQVIQVKTATDSTERSTSSTTFQTNSTLSVSITPSSASNTILLMLFNFYTYSSGGNTAVSIFRDSTNLGDATYGLFGQQDDTLVRPFSYSYLDSPSSTSAITYQIRYRAYNYGSGTINKSPQGASATTTARLVAMEIKG